jgi:hypothetical protein
MVSFFGCGLARWRIRALPNDRSKNTTTQLQID